VTAKTRKRPTRKAKNLKVKSVAHDKAKNVKGGPTMGPWRKKGLASQF
jgi:hypothetical protein